jgi:hypothetical protein
MADTATVDETVRAAERERRYELLATLVLSIATVLTAWSAFQANKWGGEMSLQFSAANAARTFSVQAANEAAAQTSVDVGVFVEYAAAVAAGDDDLASFLEERFRPEFAPAFEAWLATDPLEDPDAPATPFEMEEYALAASDEAERLAAEADAASQAARAANQQGDDYVLLTVLFASVLFFAGVSTKTSRTLARVGLTALATVLLVGAGTVMATYPILF